MITMSVFSIHKNKLLHGNTFSSGEMILMFFHRKQNGIFGSLFDENSNFKVSISWCQTSKNKNKHKAKEAKHELTSPTYLCFEFCPHSQNISQFFVRVEEAAPDSCKKLIL